MVVVDHVVNTINGRDNSCARYFMIRKTANAADHYLTAKRFIPVEGGDAFINLVWAV